MRNVLKLFSSTVAANAVRAVALLFITRIYTRADIGDFQTFFSIVIVLGMVASLKYEMAIVLPDKDEDADNLVIISFVTLLLFTCLVAVGFFLFRDAILGWLNAAALSNYVGLLIVGVFLTGLLQICRFLLIRYKRFNDLAFNKLYQSIFQQSVTIVWGLLTPSFLGLFFGYIIGALVPVWQVLRRKLFSFSRMSVIKFRQLIKQYKKFPLINTGSVFLNNFSLELPVFMFAAFFDPAAVGIYAIANQALVMPVSLVGTSVQQVYYQAASEANNDHPGKILPVYLQTIKKLALLGGLMIGAIALLAPYLAGIIFGEAFADAGIYMAILAPAMFFRFLSSPVGATYSVINRQEVQVVLVAFSVMLRFIAMYLYRDHIIDMLWALSLSTAIFYAIYNYSLYRLLSKAAAELAEEQRNNA